MLRTSANPRNVSVDLVWGSFVRACSSGVARNFVRGGGVQQIQLTAEDRDLRAVAP